jgi:sn-glycerol 3-phosphate transport system substrate-binding protein
MTRTVSTPLRMAVLAAVLALVAAACGGGADPATTTTTAGGEETTTTTAAGGDTTAPPSGEVDVNVWIAFTDNRLDWTQEVAEEFNSQIDGYRIVVQGYADYESLFDATLLAVDQGNPPAVVQYFEAATTDAQDAVDSRATRSSRASRRPSPAAPRSSAFPVVLDDVVDSARNYYTLDGEFKSMPWNTSSAIMFVNRTLLDAAGVTGTPGHLAGARGGL